MNRTSQKRLNAGRITKILLLVVLTGVMIYLYLTYKAHSPFIIYQVRVPRLILALLCGLILGGVGSVYQIMLNNPLAEPYILGVSSGAALGSVVAIIIGLYLFVPLFAFAGALLTMLMVWYLSQLGGYFSSIKLLLSGIIVGMFCSAFISLLMYLNLRDIGSIIGVLMGNLGHIFTVEEWRLFLILGLFSLILSGYLYSLSNQLNICSSGDLIATNVGVNVTKLRRNVFIVSSLLIGFIVSYAGIIGFVGLIVPHLIRMMYGNDQKRVFLLSSVGGALLLIGCDFIAMHVIVIEIPIGIITSFIGCPFFIYCFAKRK